MGSLAKKQLNTRVSFFGWMHRWCAGLSKTHFVAVGKSSTPFTCLHCTVKKQSEVMANLQGTINDLKDEFANLKSQIPVSAGNNTSIDNVNDISCSFARALIP